MAKRRRYGRKRRSSKSDEALGGIIVSLGLLLVARNVFWEYFSWFVAAALVMLISLGFFAIYNFKKRWKEERREEQYFRNIHNVTMADSMDHYRFEKFIAFLYENDGWKTNVTSQYNDEGIDIEMEREGKKVLVQVKHYKIGNNVGREELQKFVGAYSHKANEGYCVTSSSFNKNAREYAEKIPSLKLINRADIGQMIERMPDNGWQKDFLTPVTISTIN